MTFQNYIRFAFRTLWREGGREREREGGEREGERNEGEREREREGGRERTNVK